MTHVGYGCLIDGKPAGIWPMPRAEVERTAKCYRERDKTVEIVSVYADMSVAPRVAAPMMGGRSA